MRISDWSPDVCSSDLLHPWVNPPHEEDVTTANSYVGTLPEALERAKIVASRDRIAQETGKPPISFRAGRYGVGPNSARLLEEAGFRPDSSVRTAFDYRGTPAPHFSHQPLATHRARAEGGITAVAPSLPLTMHQ